jgi:hypothetical protein
MLGDAHSPATPTTPTTPTILALSAFTGRLLAKMNSDTLANLNKAMGTIIDLLTGVCSYGNVGAVCFRGNGRHALNTIFPDIQTLNGLAGTDYHSWDDVDRRARGWVDVSALRVSTPSARSILEEPPHEKFLGWVRNAYVDAYLLDPGQALRSEVSWAKRVTNSEPDPDAGAVRDDEAAVLRRIVERRVRNYSRTNAALEGGLDILNDEWGTRFSRWEVVRPPKTSRAAESVRTLIEADVRTLMLEYDRGTRFVRASDWSATYSPKTPTTHYFTPPNLVGDWWVDVVLHSRVTSMGPEKAYVFYVACACTIDDDLPRLPENTDNTEKTDEVVALLKKHYAGSIEELWGDWGAPALTSWASVQERVRRIPVLQSYTNFCDVLKDAAGKMTNSSGGGQSEAQLKTQEQMFRGSLRGFRDKWPALNREFVLRQTAEDGDCMFDAVSKALNERVSGGDAPWTCELLRELLAESVGMLRDTHTASHAYEWPNNSARSGVVEERPAFTVEGWRSFDGDALSLEELQSRIVQKSYWGTDAALRILSAVLDVRFLVLNSGGYFDCIGGTTSLSDRYILLHYYPRLHYEFVARGAQTTFLLRDLPAAFVDGWREVCGRTDDRQSADDLFA